MRDKILEYFKTNQLEILDGGTPGGEPGRDFYTGVTVPYIAEYVCDTTPDQIVDLLEELHSEGELRALYCDNVSSIVFESKQRVGSHWNYGDGHKPSISPLLKHLNSFKEG